MKDARIIKVASTIQYGDLLVNVSLLFVVYSFINGQGIYSVKPCASLFLILEFYRMCAIFILS